VQLLPSSQSLAVTQFLPPSAAEGPSLVVLEEQAPAAPTAPSAMIKAKKQREANIPRV
jgi:hypothetical protein